MKTTIYYFAIMLACGFANAQQYVNGTLSTGTISKSGLVAPAGRTWAELQNNGSDLSSTNGSFGMGIDGPSYSTYFADDFTIPAGESWDLNQIEVYASIESTDTGTMPFNTFNFEIWNGDPQLPSSQKIYGNINTNIFNAAASGDSFMTHIKNTAFLTPPFPMRTLWRVVGDIDVTLPAGTYWIYYRTLGGILTGSTCAPYCIVEGTRGLPHYNAKAYTVLVHVWNIAQDLGAPLSAESVPQDYPFKINYTQTLGIDGHNVNHQIIAYPNPTEGNLFFGIGNPVDDNTKIIISDLRGLTVLEKTAENFGTYLKTDVSQLQSGLYIVRVVTGGNSIYQGKITKN